MIVHSDSTLGAMLAIVVVLGAIVSLPIAADLFLAGKTRQAAKALLAAAALVAAYTLAVIAASLLTPRRIVEVGDSYCVDIWCIGIDRVTPTRRGDETSYRLDALIFSDATRVKTSAAGASLFLVDERGRRFPLVPDPASVPFDVSLDPRESVHTSLTFVAPTNARQLFLSGDTGNGPPFWVRLYLGSDNSLLHKPTLLRVL